MVIVRGGRVALIKRVRDGRTYYVFLGGGIEEGETPERAAVREAREELGVDVTLDALLFVLKLDGGEQFFYRASIVGGEFGTGSGPEFWPERQLRRGTYSPVWVPLDKMHVLDVRPRTVGVAVSAGAGPEQREASVAEK